jgi:hypothetical protein
MGPKNLYITNTHGIRQGNMKVLARGFSSSQRGGGHNGANYPSTGFEEKRSRTE